LKRNKNWWTLPVFFINSTNNAFKTILDDSIAKIHLKTLHRGGNGTKSSRGR
jgi:hypothetical protein